MVLRDVEPEVMDLTSPTNESVDGFSCNTAVHFQLRNDRAGSRSLPLYWGTYSGLSGPTGPDPQLSQYLVASLLCGYIFSI